MKGRRPGQHSKTWKKLMLLCQKQGPIGLKVLAKELCLTEKETMDMIQKVFPQGVGVKIYYEGSEGWVDIDTKALQYVLPLNPAEWMQLQQLLFTANNKMKSSKIFSSLKKKVSEISPVKVMRELLGQLEVWDQQMSESQQKTIDLLDEAIQESKVVQMTNENGKVQSVYPCKVLHLEGQLSLIAEDTQDHCLAVIMLKEVSEIETIKTDGQPSMTVFEVEEFIGAIRSMNEKETRLILKIHNPESVNLFPDHHFLGKPCMITNSNGDLIWAAYVEPCEDLFEWLAALGKNVEILDPMKFKQEFLSYCEEKIRKIA